MIADMSKYINTLREKGRSLFNSYLALKKHLEELRYTIGNYSSLLLNYRSIYPFYVNF